MEEACGSRFMWQSKGKGKMVKPGWAHWKVRPFTVADDASQ
jgi:hypothetical protein